MESNRPFIIRIFTENKGLKLLGLILALITWYAIQGVINFEIVLMDVPVRIEVNKGWAVLDRSTDVVDIQFRGPQEDLLRLNRDYVEVLLDMRGSDFEGSKNVLIKPDMVRVLSGIRVVSIRPDNIILSLDREGSKTVPVKVEMQGQLPEGYEVDKVVCTPATIVVKGPLQRIAEIERVRTVALNMETRNQSFRERVALMSPSDRWDAELSPEKVTVDIVIKEYAATRLIKGVDVYALLKAGKGSELSITPAQVNVTLEGREEMLNRVRPMELKAYIDCSGLEAAARYELPVRVDVSGDVVVGAIEPSTVSVGLDLR